MSQNSLGLDCKNASFAHFHKGMIEIPTEPKTCMLVDRMFHLHVANKGEADELATNKMNPKEVQASILSKPSYTQFLSDS